MEKYIYEETNGLWYERRGDYYFPCLTAEETTPIGVWGQRHLRFIKQNRRAVSGAESERQAERLSRRH